MRSILTTIWSFSVGLQVRSARAETGQELDASTSDLTKGWSAPSAIAATNVHSAIDKHVFMGIREQKSKPTTSLIKTTPDSRFSQSLVKPIPDFKALCIKQGGWIGPRLWTHWFKDAQCAPDKGNQRTVKVTCGSKYFFPTPREVRQYYKDDKILYTECPEGTVCQTVYIPVKGDGVPLERGRCLIEEGLVRETVRSDPTKSNQKVHCGLSLELPGSHYRPAPGQQRIDLVLTEQVQFPDGSPYPAPLLFIRDISSSGKNPDRALRRDTNVVSSQIELGVYRGRFLSKTFEFCMQMLPGHAMSPAICTYSFFQVNLHHGRISNKLDNVSGN